MAQRQPTPIRLNYVNAAAEQQRQKRYSRLDRQREKDLLADRRLSLEQMGWPTFFLAPIPWTMLIWISFCLFLCTLIPFPHLIVLVGFIGARLIHYHQSRKS